MKKPKHRREYKEADGSVIYTYDNAENIAEESKAYTATTPILGTISATMTTQGVSIPMISIPKIIYCKDCKYYKKSVLTVFDYPSGAHERPLYMCSRDVIDWADPDDFCSRAVAK